MCSSDLPTIAESGLPGYQASIWTGMFGPAKLPRSLIDVLHKQAARAVQEPGFRAKMNQLGADTVGSTPEEWGKFMEAEIAKWGKIARVAGLKPE